MLQKNLNPCTVFWGADHAGLPLKQHLVSTFHIVNQIAVRDFGTFSETSCDYPDIVHRMMAEMEAELFAGNPTLGVLICGSGNGVCMTANKYKHIRAGLAWMPEIAKLLRQHNDANVLCLPQRFISLEDATQCVATFLHTPFEGGRHLSRVEKIHKKLG